MIHVSITLRTRARGPREAKQSQSPHPNIEKHDVRMGPALRQLSAFSSSQGWSSRLGAEGTPSPSPSRSVGIMDLGVKS